MGGEENGREVKVSCLFGLKRERPRSTHDRVRSKGRDEWLGKETLRRGGTQSAASEGAREGNGRTFTPGQKTDQWWGRESPTNCGSSTSPLQSSHSPRRLSCVKRGRTLEAQS